RGFIAAYSSEMFGESVDSLNISEALFACYEEKTELGVCAFVFDSPATANAAIKQLLVGTKADRFFHAQKGNVAVIVWNDGVSDSVFQYFKEHTRVALRLTEQDSADQSATAPESKSEGDLKPQPE
ncbi:MAG: hypothetical protein AAF585_10185, partial [Verrucomicrobiota bacterium]